MYDLEALRPLLDFPFFSQDENREDKNSLSLRDYISLFGFVLNVKVCLAFLLTCYHIFLIKGRLFLNQGAHIVTKVKSNRNLPVTCNFEQSFPDGVGVSFLRFLFCFALVSPHRFSHANRVHTQTMANT